MVLGTPYEVGAPEREILDPPLCKHNNARDII